MNNSEFDYIRTFPPLGHPEHHFNKYPNHPWLKTKDEIWRFLKKFDENFYIKYIDGKDNRSEYVVYDDLTVGLKVGTVNMSYKEISLLLVQFRVVKDFYIECSYLESMVGVPYNTERLSLIVNKLKDWKGLENVNCLTLDVGSNYFDSFKGMPEFKNRSMLLDMNDNRSNIESWDGFTNIENIVWWQDRWCAKTSYDLLMKTPQNIKEIMNISGTFRSGLIRVDENWNINMDWLRREQKNRLILSQVKEDIIFNISHESNEDIRNKKRKI